MCCPARAIDAERRIGELPQPGPPLGLARAPLDQRRHRKQQQDDRKPDQCRRRSRSPAFSPGPVGLVRSVYVRGASPVNRARRTAPPLVMMIALAVEAVGAVEVRSPVWPNRSVPSGLTRWTAHATEPGERGGRAVEHRHQPCAWRQLPEQAGNMALPTGVAGPARRSLAPTSRDAAGSGEVTASSPRPGIPSLSASCRRRAPRVRPRRNRRSRPLPPARLAGARLRKRIRLPGVVHAGDLFDDAGGEPRIDRRAVLRLHVPEREVHHQRDLVGERRLEAFPAPAGPCQSAGC